ncbi:hypothetical protein EVAR_87660_1 [Eumeta japonica]|uniref:Uncharacterized protein n=1 Tax=Eumeta variegata TaxID=151549 RepID=A0A4C1WJ95_EUMVA|nr:hypothetical protein EVAR_87660_1 [Eumeta japonica]
MSVIQSVGTPAAASDDYTVDVIGNIKPSYCYSLVVRHGLGTTKKKAHLFLKGQQHTNLLVTMGGGDHLLSSARMLVCPFRTYKNNHSTLHHSSLSV